MMILMALLLTGCGGSDNKELSIVENVPPSIDFEELPESLSELPSIDPDSPIIEEPILDPEPTPPPPLTQQERYLAAVNEFRLTEQLCPGEGTVYAAAPPVQWDGNLELASIIHSTDMATNDFFSHTGSDNSHFSSRAFNAGYKGSPIFEVIAAGSSDFNGTLQQWINSRTGHCGFLMRQDVNEIGAGFAFDSSSTHGYYWALLGGRK